MPPYSTRTIAAMGTRLSIFIPEQGKESLIELAMEECRRLESLMSRHNPHSALAILNRTGKIVDNDLQEILSLCLDYQKKSLGYFNIGILPLIELWEIKHGHCNITSPPSNEQISIAKKQVMENECFLAEIIKNPDAERPKTLGFDLGAFAKGYAIEAIIKCLKDNGVNDAFISFGESSIAAIGKNPKGSNWEIAVPDERYKKELISFELIDQSISISGFNFAENYGIPEYSHIINSKTARPVKAGKRIIVSGQSAAEIEVLSTALSACEMNQDREEILNNFINCSAFEIRYFGDRADIIKLN